MKEKYYSSERSVQILISLLKQYGIKKVIASPGTTNLTFVGSLMCDPWFELYSSVDERSAAYIACGMSATSGEPVVLTSTGATASRNYLSGLTEAYYRKLPIVAVTSCQDKNKIGHLGAQVIDRSSQPADTVICSEHIEPAITKNAEWDATIRINRALQALTRHGGGPVHINLTSTYSNDYSVKELPAAKKIHRIDINSDMPELPKSKIAIWIGNHRPFNDRETAAIEHFCTKYDAIVICDHTSNYHGEHRAFIGLTATQKQYNSDIFDIDLLIHLGEVSADYASMSKLYQAKEVWRVSEDGEIRDLFGQLTHIFEMKEEDFFSSFTTRNSESSDDGFTYLKKCLSEEGHLMSIVPELPFSNIWIAKTLSSKLPKHSIAHFAILNSMRSWNFWDIDKTIDCYCNSGGFGIDGCMSSCIGSALANKDRIHFLFIGDLAFFYDMNSLGNRYLPSNIRILLVNNGKGTEFRNYCHPAYAFGEEADAYIAAAGHFGNKSSQLVKHYAEDLGCKYLFAHSKEEFLAQINEFTSDVTSGQPIVFEAFTNSENESAALNALDLLSDSTSSKLKKIARMVLPDPIVDQLRKLIP